MNNNNIENIISSYYPDFERTMKLAELEELATPITSLVELRYAVSHLERSISKKLASEKEEEIKKAGQHFRRATIDNIDLVVVSRIKLIRKALASRNFTAKNRESALKNLDRLEKIQKELKTGISNEQVNKIINSLIHDIETKEALLGELLLADDKQTNKKANSILSFIVGVLVSLLAALIYSYMKP